MDICTTTPEAGGEMPRLDARLETAASLVRQGGVVLDVGTDHGYLPIALLLRGVCKSAVASDVHRGPLERAAADAAKWGVSMRLYLSDGLDGVEPAENGVTDICICGMGGELIASIVARSAYTRQPGIRLILQPMSRAQALRQYLLENGYAIRTEKLCRAAGRIYTCMAAEFTGGNMAPYDEAYLLVGRQNPADPLYRPYIAAHLRAVQKQIRGRLAGGRNTENEQRLAAALEEMLSQQAETADSCPQAALANTEKTEKGEESHAVSGNL